MPAYRFIAKSERDNGKVKGEITLTVDAESREDAEDKVRASLPGFDWAQWESFYGVVEIEEK